jgi:hypothetical protein
VHHILAAAPAAPIPPWINLSALWQIVVLGLLAGAGLPALFAIGLRALALSGGNGPATGVDATAGGSSDQLFGGNPVGLIAGGICFLVVLGAIGWGIWQIWYLGHPH